MAAVWELVERALHWVLEQLLTLDRILAAAASIHHRIHADLPEYLMTTH